MKKLAERLLTVAMLATVLATACTPDEGTPEPNFPAEVSAFVEPASSYMLNLSPNQEWMVSIPSTASDYWGIRDGEQISNSVGGRAGDVTVEIVCLAEMQDLEPHTVEVSMSMGGQTRVIATLELAAGEPELIIRPAVTAQEQDNPDHKYFQASDGSDGLIYEYAESGLADGETVPMLWDASRNGYVSYILVESNFNYGTEVTAGLRAEELQSPESSARLSEYEIFCSAVNLSDIPAEHDFNLTSDAPGYETVPVTFSAPQFVPHIEVRKATVTSDGQNFETPSGDDSPYNWLYEEEPLVLASDASGLPEAGTVDMIWRPSATIAEVDSYILIRSNFTFTVLPDQEWLSTDAGTKVDETSDTYETETYYRIYVAPEVLETGGAAGSVTINMGDADDDVYSQCFNVSSPNVSDIFYVTTVPTFSFDADGKYIQEEMTSGTNAETEITSAAPVKVMEFYLSEGWYRDDNDAMAVYYGGGWIKSSAYPDTEDGNAGDTEEDGFVWGSGNARIQTNALTVELEPNDGGDPREGMIMAFPKGVWEKMQTTAEGNPYWGDITSLLFPENLGGAILDPDYADYIVAYIEQSAPAGPVEPYMPEYWEAAGASFETLYDDPIIMDFGVQNCYLITYTYSDLDVTPTFGVESQFSLNFDYTDYEILDGNLEPFEDGVQPWIKLAEGDDGMYYVEATPGEVTAKSAYVAFIGDGGYVAAIKVSYEPGGGSEDLELGFAMPTQDFTLEELTGTDKPAGIENPCWLLTCNNPEGAMATISGLPADLIHWGEESWLSITPMAGMTMFDVNGSLVTADNNECNVTIASSSGNILCVIVCRVITE